MTPFPVPTASSWRSKSPSGLDHEVLMPSFPFNKDAMSILTPQIPIHSMKQLQGGWASQDPWLQTTETISD